MRRRLWAAIMLCTLANCTHQPAVVVDVWQLPRSIQGGHRVGPGETLYSIAWRYHKDYLQLAGMNRLSSPYRLKTGQWIYLSKGQTQSHHVLAYAPLPLLSKGHWYAPLRHGVLKKGFSHAHPGIDWAASLGSKVHAMGEGEVVYAGAGIRGYGYLILIQHNRHVLSAYAHNAELLVHEGQRVHARQVIAKVGQTDTNYSHLHFEVRWDGRAVNPKKFIQ